jgi:hypothetical protein
MQVITFQRQSLVTYPVVPSDNSSAPPTTVPSAPKPTVPPLVNDSLNTKLLSAVKPAFKVALHPQSPNVLQCAVLHPTSGQWYTTQADNGTNGTRDPYESVWLSRMSSTGVLQDYMKLDDAGHGTSFSIEVSGGVTYIWMTYKHSAAGSTTEQQLVRFSYAAGTYNRDTLPNKTVYPHLDSGYCVYSFDWASDYLVVRASGGTRDNYIRRRISEFKLGIDHKYGQINLQQGPPALQGFCTINGSLFRYIGTANGEILIPADPTMIQQYSWASGRRVDQVAYPDLGKSPNGTFPNNWHEPESCTMYRDPVTNKASVMFSVTVGTGTGRGYPVWTLKDIGQPPVAIAASSRIGSARIGTSRVV